MFTGINNEFYLTKKWPTMAKAKSSHKRIFVFVEVEEQEDLNHLGNEEGIIGEVKVKKNDQNIPNISGTVTMYSGTDHVQMIKVKCRLKVNCTNIQKHFTI